MTGQTESNQRVDSTAQRAGSTSLGWNLSGSLLFTLTQVHFALGMGGEEGGL